MRRRCCVFIVVSTLLAVAAKQGHAQDAVPLHLSGEFAAEETYVGEAGVRHSTQRVEDFDEHDVIVRFVLTPRVKLGVLRIGAEFERFSFGFADRSPLPNTLQEASFVFGIDTQWSDSILIRFEAQPGFYGTNHLDWDDINVPFLAGGTYIYNPDLQFVIGVSVDIERQFPVIPAAGIRWKFARRWVANAVLPQPRLEYEWSKSLTVYLGGNIKQTNFRMPEDFGDTHGSPRLNRAVLSYSEARAGLGFDWKLASFAAVNLEAGYQPYRSFDFYRADLRFHENGSAPYGMISVHGAF
jgi:hypothetical protein